MASAPRSPFLRARALAEAAPLARVQQLCGRVGVLPLLAYEPVGAAALSELTKPATEGTLIDAR
jgi:arsenite-transporting ATPase